MKLKLIFIAMLAIFSTANLLAQDQVVASFNNIEVKESDVINKYPMIFSQAEYKNKKLSDLEPKMRELLIKNYVLDIVLSAEVKNSNIQNTKAFKDKLATIESYIKSQLPKEAFLEQIAQKAISEKQIDHEYDKLVKDLKGKKRLKVSHILVSDEKTAKEAKSRIDRGVAFVEVCQQYSIDPSAKVNSCSLGIINQGQLVAEFEKVAFSMKIGTISEPVKTQFGWHIIKVDDKLDSVIPPKAEVIESIKQNIYKKASEQYVNDLLAKSKLKIIVKK